MKNFFEKIKIWFNSMFNAVKSALSNLKLWLVKNIDFIKKCLCVVLLGLLCVALVPFSCRSSSSSTAKADTYDNSSDTAIIYSTGVNTIIFNVSNTSSFSPLRLSFVCGFEFNYYTNSVFMLLPSNYRIDLSNVTAEDGTSAVELPSVFVGEAVGASQPLSSMSLTIMNTSINVTEEDFLNSPNWKLTARSLTGTQFNIIFENVDTGGGVVFTAFFTYNDIIRNFYTFAGGSSFKPIIYTITGGYDVGYSAGYDVGVEEGYSAGYVVGTEEGYDSAISDGSSGGVFGGFVSAVNSFFDIQLIGNVTIANVLQIGFGIILLGFIIKIFLGG